MKTDMKTIGLLGGMSWESTQDYYRLINTGVKERLGGLHSAQIVMVSLDFEPIEQLQCKGEWDTLGRMLSHGAKRIEAAGADTLLICTNTMHKVAGPVQDAVQIPLLHIADATAREIKADGIKKVGLLGTAFTMEQEFYKGRLRDHYGMDVLVPDPDDRQTVHDVIYKELCLGQINDASKARYHDIIKRLADQGAEAVILGCTEIGLLVKQEETPVRLLDTTAIHAQAAVDFAISGGQK